MSVAKDGGPSLNQLAPESPARFDAPQFYITGRQPMSPAAVLLAIVVAVCALCLVLFGLSRRGTAARQSEQDDPDQVDVIVIGEPGAARAPAKAGEHVSPVHPTILVHLPRSGEQMGLIPNSAAGHLLYNWLAAFNRASYPALAEALPTNVAAVTAAQMELRRQTGGLSLLSAKEVEPGILVFRLQDQTPAANEVLGTLQMGSSSITSFRLQTVAPPPRR